MRTSGCRRSTDGRRPQSSRKHAHVETNRLVGPEPALPLRAPRGLENVAGVPVLVLGGEKQNAGGKSRMEACGHRRLRRPLEVDSAALGADRGRAGSFAGKFVGNERFETEGGDGVETKIGLHGKECVVVEWDAAFNSARASRSAREEERHAFQFDPGVRIPRGDGKPLRQSVDFGANG